MRYVLPLIALALGLGFAREARAGVLFTDDFESGTGAWTLQGGFGTTSTGPHAGTKSLTDSPGYNYSNGISTTVTATKITPLNLTNAQWPRFWFWLRYSSEAFHDYLHVETSTNGTAWTTQNSFQGSQTEWKLFEVSLGPGYAGKAALYVRFRVETDSIISDDGWYIDDFVFDDGNPAITISAPDSSSVWKGGSTQDIMWTNDGTWSPLATSLNVYYSDDNIIFYSVQSGLAPTATTVAWNVPASTNVSTMRVRVDLRDTYDNVLTQTTTAPFKVDSTNPGTFSLTSPANAACGSPTPKFDWGDSTDTNGVKYTLTVTPAAASPFTKTNLSASEYTLSGGEALSDAGNPHSWSVTATDPAGNTRTSSARTYDADSTPPATFALSSPVDGTNSDGTGIVFAWDTTTDVGCGLSYYALYIDGNVCADNLSTGTTSIALESTTCAPLSGGDHTWTVAAVDLAGNVTWSSASPGGTGGWTITLPGASGAGGAGGDGGAAGAAGAPEAGSAGVSGSDGGSGGDPLGSGGEPATGTGATGGTSLSGSGGIGAAGGDGAGGSAGSPATGGNAGTTTLPGTGGQNAGGTSAASAPRSSSDDGGCGCRLGARPARSDFASLISLAAVLACRWRRRRRH